MHSFGTLQLVVANGIDIGRCRIFVPTQAAEHEISQRCIDVVRGRFRATIQEIVGIVRHLIRREFEDPSTQTRIVPCVFGGAARFRIEVNFLDLPLAGEDSRKGSAKCVGRDKESTNRSKMKYFPLSRHDEILSNAGWHEFSGDSGDRLIAEVDAIARMI
ncbi:hypothetical protein WJ59_19495 [Burkholderia gladioli]|nr:hypothetical protein WJ59_19495 [Burkholderia gladioli]